MEDLRSQIKDWMTVCHRNYSDNTCSMYHSVLYQLSLYLASDGQTLTREAVEGYLDDKLKQGCSRALFNKYLIAIRSFATWRKRVSNTTSPVHAIPFIKEDPPNQRVLSDKEFEICLEHTKRMDNDIILFLGNTGLRRTEFRDLNWDDIDTQLRFVSVEGKGRKRRVVPLNFTCQDVIRKYKRLPGEPFQLSQRYPGQRGASWLCTRIATETGIPQFGVHAIRHYFATMMIKKGVSIYKLSRILGHASVTTTERIYLHLVPVDLLGLTDCLD